MPDARVTFGVQLLSTEGVYSMDTGRGNSREGGGRVQRRLDARLGDRDRLLLHRLVDRDLLGRRGVSD